MSATAGKTVATLAVAALLSACATPQPVPFDLVDAKNTVHHGTFLASGQQMEVMVEGKLYQGFYVFATGVASSMEPWGRYGRYGPWGSPFPGERLTVINSNSARAHLSSADGDRLSCEFLAQGSYVVGECKSPQGKTYQMVATPAK